MSAARIVRPLRHWLLAILAVAIVGQAAPNGRDPHLGYLFPAGGRQGTTLHVIAAGQQFGGVSEVYVTGNGVHATVVRPVPTVRNLEREQLLEARQRLLTLRQNPRADSILIKPEAKSQGGKPASQPARKRDGSTSKPAAQPARKADGAASKPATQPARKADGAASKPATQAARKPDGAASKPTTQPVRKTDGPTSKTATQPVRKPDGPAGKPPNPPSGQTEVDVDALSLRELEYYLSAIRYRDRKQTNPQLAQAVLLEITIDANAAPGDRELRLASPNGLSNPLRFQVGSLPEISEQEPVGSETPVDPNLSPPFLINGQIMPGDVDRFHFQAKQGQHLVLDVQARRLIPYLADAVPGWFQATAALYDAAGNELAFVDDYRFNPDPVLLYEVPSDGEYQLEIRDALYRGREDFVYRVTVGELPFVTQIYPLGGHAGDASTAAVSGWNLRRERIQLDTPAGTEGIRSTFLQRGKWRSNEFLYAVDTIPSVTESEPNDDREHAQRMMPPHIVNGRIDRPDDVDVYQVAGHKGEELVAEVYARRLNSPLDARLSITDATGNVVAWNDDMDTPVTGLLTHNADAYLRVRFPANGAYYVKVADAQQHGGEEYGYRLRLSAPRPDFELRLTPSSISVPRGRCVPISVHVLRKDGFDGDIELALVGTPAGFALQGGRIPGGCDRVRFTIAAPPEAPEQPVTLKLEGRAQIGPRLVTRPVIPAEDMMQAFSYHHLVPAQELQVKVLPTKQVPPTLALSDTLPARIPVGGTVELHVNTPARGWLRGLELALSEPPAGVSLVSVSDVPGGALLVLKADKIAAQPGLRDNLIIEAFAGTARPERNAPTRRTARIPVACLPAIPIEIVRQ